MTATAQQITVTLTPKQVKALAYLASDSVTEVLFGGGAGGAKSWLGCYWAIKNCIKYPGCRGLVGRSVLKTLKETTLNTFFDVAKSIGLMSETDYKYNEQKGRITFWNGSEILLKDLYAYPSDPEFDSLGSLEISFAFIDECNQVTVKAKDIVKSRIRYKIDEFGIRPKILMTCNPAKNWVYQQFYKPWKDDTLPPSRAFVQALAKDNPFISPFYIDNLRTLDKNSRERLLEGNWEYDDDPLALIEYDAIVDAFHNDHVQETGQRFITVDAAMHGSDVFRVAAWNGFVMVEHVAIPKSGGKEILDAVNALRQRHQVRPGNVVYDADGVGAFLGGEGGFIPGARPFNNGGKPFKENGKDANYENLKTQCYYHMARRINQGGYYFRAVTEQEDRDTLSGELEQVKSRDIDKDGKLKIKRKEDIKQDIGRSPDFSDIVMMREYFELNQGLPQML